MTMDLHVWAGLSGTEREKLDERATVVAAYYNLDFHVNPFGYVIQQPRGDKGDDRRATDEEVAMWTVLTGLVPEEFREGL